MISLDNSDKKFGLGSDTWLEQNLGPLGELVDSDCDRDNAIYHQIWPISWTQDSQDLILSN